MVKTMPAMQDMQIPSLGQEDSLEKEMTTHSILLLRKSHGWSSLVKVTPFMGS